MYMCNSYLFTTVCDCIFFKTIHIFHCKFHEKLSVKSCMLCEFNIANMERFTVCKAYFAVKFHRNYEDSVKINTDGSFVYMYNIYINLNLYLASTNTCTNVSCAPSFIYKMYLFVHKN